MRTRLDWQLACEAVRDVFNTNAAPVLNCRAGAGNAEAAMAEGNIYIDIKLPLLQAGIDYVHRRHTQALQQNV